MTSEFDNLDFIVGEVSGSFDGKPKPMYEPLALWLADICIKEASSREPRWTYEKWLKGNKERALALYGDEKWLPYAFLHDTHDILDHSDKWHGKVFCIAVWYLIKLVKDVVSGKKRLSLTKTELRRLKPYIEKLRGYLSKLDYRERERGYWIKEGVK